MLYQKEFVWTVHHDDNRVADGRALRHEFVSEMRFQDVEDSWMSLGCSFFEMLFALARRASFLDDDTPSEWFWILMENLDLHIFNDRMEIDENFIDGILDRVIWRTYDANGNGGIFPLSHPREDQRRVELWYQLNAYLLENDR